MSDMHKVSYAHAVRQILEQSDASSTSAVPPQQHQTSGTGVWVEKNTQLQAGGVPVGVNGEYQQILNHVHPPHVPPLRPEQAYQQPPPGFYHPHPQYSQVPQPQPSLTPQFPLQPEHAHPYPQPAWTHHEPSYPGYGYPPTLPQPPSAFVFATPPQQQYATPLAQLQGHQ
eukprot:8253549-Pyramimonas_sp.AAC.1